jgi:hypothetical protein
MEKGTCTNIHPKTRLTMISLKRELMTRVAVLILVTKPSAINVEHLQKKLW